jgi:hypothetical protein
MTEPLCLLRDVNLSEIYIYPDGTKITIKFLSMFDGHAVATLTTYDVIVFNYHNAFDCSADALPTHVGEVTCRSIAQEQVHICLAALAYKFAIADDYSQSTLMNGAILIHIEGGEVAIDILCGRYEINAPTR